jgi:hypothetical protein
MEALRQKIRVFATRYGLTDHFSASRATAATTGAGMIAGAAARRGHAAIRRSHRRTHLCEVTAHGETPQRVAPASSLCCSLADAGADGATATKSAVLRATEELGARSTDCTSWGIIPGGVSDPQAARGAQPRRPTDR